MNRDGRIRREFFLLLAVMLLLYWQMFGLAWRMLSRWF
jgi:hypothetical protein